MHILLNSDNEVIEAGTFIEYGTFDEPDVEKWYVENTHIGLRCYYIDYNFTSIEVDTIPEDFRSYKYCYTADKGFYKNPTYIGPFSLEDEIIKIQETTSAINLRQAEAEADTDFRLSMLELGSV